LPLLIHHRFEGFSWLSCLLGRERAPAAPQYGYWLVLGCEILLPPAASALALTRLLWLHKLAIMQVNLRPETESRLQELAAKSGRAPDDLVEDAMVGYLQELGQVREMLDGRYSDLKNGRVKPLDGEEAFALLRRKSDERRSNRS
jgi:predicted transcriptional regulator